MRKSVDQSPSQPGQHLKPTVNEAAIAGYMTASDNASLGREGIDELRTILNAVAELANDNDVIRSLAILGVTLADSRDNRLDCEYAAAQEQARKLKGASHG